MPLTNTLADVPGIHVGHAQDLEAFTGCTVVLCEAGAVGGVDQRGGAPGTRETDLLRPMRLVEKVHAVVLAGGSAFGLDAASGVMKYLEERQIGYETGVARIPIVPAAILFDLALGRADVRPDAQMGYRACLAASVAPPPQGNVGAGAGASVGKILGMAQAVKAGVGMASVPAGGEVIVSALAAVNALGDVVDPASGRIIAGARNPVPGGAPFADTLAILRETASRKMPLQPPRGNTIIGVVATNARLTKEQANKVAEMAHDGLARAVRPAHTLYDGDTIFALATGAVEADVNAVGSFAAEAFAQAILQAVLMAEPAGGLPAARNFFS